MPRIAKRLALVLVVLSAVGAAAHFGWAWWTVGRYVESTDDAYVRGDITPISPKVAGYISALNVTDNQHVRKGDVLAHIDDTDFRLAVTEAAARVAQAKAAIANMDARVARQQAVIDRARAGVAAAEAELDLRERELARARNLLKRKTGTRQKFDFAEAARRKAAAQLRQARARHRESVRDTRVLESERERLVALLAESEAALALARTKLADTTITAPVSGVVGNRSVRVGQYVRPGTLLMAIVPLTRVWVEANFKETQLTRMRVGQPAEITVDTYPGLTLNGRVQSFSPASGAEFSLLPPENATGNFTKLVQRIPVKIVLDDPASLPGPLRPGMSVEASVDTRAGGPEDAAAPASR